MNLICASQSRAEFKQELFFNTIYEEIVDGVVDELITGLSVRVVTFTQKKKFFSNNYSKKLYQSRTKLYDITIIQSLYRNYISSHPFCRKTVEYFNYIILKVAEKFWIH